MSASLNEQFVCFDVTVRVRTVFRNNMRHYTRLYMNMRQHARHNMRKDMIVAGGVA